MNICGGIRKVRGGYVVELPWPYGDSCIGMGEVLCRTFDEVVTELARSAGELSVGEKVSLAWKRREKSASEV